MTTNLWLSDIATEAGGALEGVPVCEEHGSRKENFGATSFEATVILRCPWAKRFAVVWDIYQNNVAYPDTLGGTQNKKRAYLSSFSIGPSLAAPLGTTLFVQEYEEALITVKYSTEESEAQRLFIQSIEPALQNMVLDEKDYYRGVTGGTTWERQCTAREAPAKLQVMWNYTIKWIQQEKVPEEYAKLAGRVNNAQYTIKDIFGATDLVCATESMLYQPGGITKSVWLKLATSGTTPDYDKVPFPGWDFTLKFTINQIDNADDPAIPVGLWNKPFRADAKNVVNEIDNYERIYKGKEPGPGTPFEIYVPKTFPIDDGTASGVHFLPGVNTLVQRKAI